MFDEVPGPGSGNLRVIVALLFDRRASPADVRAFKDALIGCPLVLHSAEVSGSFDFIVEAAFSDMGAYNDQLHCMDERLAALVTRYETCFVGRTFNGTQESDQAIWVPVDNGLKRIDCTMIDKIVAEGDYMLVYSGGRSWMVHSTLRSLVELLPEEDVVQINRSVVVRCDFIDSLKREGRHWFAVLEDGTEEPVAKSRSGEMVRRLKTAPSKSRSGSSTENHPVDALVLK
jgi:hypothetical protein